MFEWCVYRKNYIVVGVGGGIGNCVDCMVRYGGVIVL